MTAVPAPTVPAAPPAPTVPEASEAPSSAPARYTVSLARDASDVRAAQRLRHDVFAAELGAHLRDAPEPGIDADAFDAFCDHLLVRDATTEQVVGTYRLLPPDRAAAAGGWYSEGEFDLGALAGIRPELVEVGRSCVHPDHRDGAVIGLIWAGIARYLTEGGHTWLGGCCSVPLDDGGRLAADTWDQVRERHLAPEEYRVRPLLPWRHETVSRTAGTATDTGRTALPALLRGYLRLGAWVCAPPAYDPDFGVADLYVLLSMRRLHPRYLRHFLSLCPAS
ncbi:GNAT family N-acetyltransferase [Streptomyces odontomachi]|uniref:GNAT family N-acetyltransferase n=1 Tax=Streptomyces odontomachi TaxID=2944940 RepID=UPI00210D9C28|nr:GNAT family N-acyltransferase [Streptomyces sp. ODS25]